MQNKPNESKIKTEIENFQISDAQPLNWVLKGHVRDLLFKHFTLNMAN